MKLVSLLKVSVIFLLAFYADQSEAMFGLGRSKSSAPKDSSPRSRSPKARPTAPKSKKSDLASMSQGAIFEHYNKWNDRARAAYIASPAERTPDALEAIHKARAKASGWEQSMRSEDSPAVPLRVIRTQKAEQLAKPAAW